MHRTPAPSRAPPPTLTLLSASQPDFVRAVQKDELYQQLLIDSCHEAVRRVLGPYTALQYNRQSRLAAVLLYHGLTTGCGEQTLGEEYCNMMQVTQGSASPPSLPRRLALVLLEALGPYLAESAATQLDRQAAELAEQQHEPQQGTSQDTDRRDVNSHAGTLLSVSGGPSAGGPWSGWFRAMAGTGAAAHGTRERWCLSPAALRWLASAWPTRIKPALSFAARFHLALFYCYGAVYQLSHRLAGIRYISTSRPIHGRTSYQALGILLMLQLLIVAAMHAARESSQAAQQQQQQRRVGGSDALSAAAGAMLTGQEGQPGSGHACVLEEDFLSSEQGGGAKEASAAGEPRAALRGQPGAPATTAQRQPEVDALAMSASSSRAGPAPACPLCLSPRRSPASTPCGHVFCWQCVAQWCNEKPECPLCRATVLLPQLVPVYHSDLF